MGGNVDPTFTDLYIEAVPLIDPLVGGRVITRELSLRKPLLLQRNRVNRFAVANADRGLVTATGSSKQRQDCQHRQQSWRQSLLHHSLPGVVVNSPSTIAARQGMLTRSTSRTNANKPRPRAEATPMAAQATSYLTNATLDVITLPMRS